MQMTGERQVGTTLDAIKPDHRNRYIFVSTDVKVRVGKDNADMIDLGCGIGYGSFVLAEEGHTVMGIDNCPEAIDEATEYYSSKNIVFALLDLSTDNWPLSSDHKLDAVTAFEILEHLENPDQFLQNISKITDRLYVSVPNEEVMPFNRYNFPFHERHYTMPQFIEILERNGFEVKDVYTQMDKVPGEIVEGHREFDKNGRTLIAYAERKQ